MAFNDPFFSTMNFVYDNDEVTFDDLGNLLGLPGRAGRPPVIPAWMPAYGTLSNTRKLNR